MQKNRLWEIMVALYEHEALLAKQIDRLVCSYNNTLSTTQYTLRVMVKEGLIIKKQVGYKALHGSDALYCLTKKGHNIVAMELEIEDFDDKITSYNFKEIQVKGSIKRHIYLQEWVSLLQNKFININERDIDYMYKWIEHCQPNRNPILNNGTKISYTPGWIIFHPNGEIDNREHLALEAGTILFHHQIREELYFPSDECKMWVNLECDLESEDYSRLKRKLVNVKENIDHVSDILVIFTAIDAKLQHSKTTSFDKGIKRLRNVRKIVLKIMEAALTGEVIQIVQGELRQTLDTCNKIFWEGRTHQFEAEPINWGYLLKNSIYLANEEKHLKETVNMDPALYKPFFDEFLLFKREDNYNFDVQFIINTRTGLLNPIAKMNKLQKNMKSCCNHIKKKYVFVFPNHKEMTEEIVDAGNDDVYYVALEEVYLKGYWGDAYQYVSRDNTEQWINVSLVE